jgi:hypothetical protein
MKMSLFQKIVLYSFFTCSGTVFAAGDGFEELDVKYSVDIKKKIDDSLSTKDTIATSKTTYQIDRFAGCYGDMKKAQKNPQPAKGNLQEPIFHQNTFDRSILKIEEKSKPVCIAFDNPQGIASFDDSIMNIQEYMFEEVWSCDYGCGDDYCTDDKGEEIDLNSWDSLISKKNRDDFHEYDVARKKEVAEQQKVFAQYKEDYGKWESKRKKYLPSGLVRYQIQVPQDISAGTIAIYSYTWRADFWCGDPGDVRKDDMMVKYIPLEKVKKGQVIDVWLENAFIGETWGFVLGSSPETLQQDVEDIQNEVQIRKEQREKFSGSDLTTLPENIQNRAGESTKGHNSEEINECCGC